MGVFSESKETAPSVPCLITIWPPRWRVNSQIYLRWLLELGEHSLFFQFWARGLSLLPSWSLCQGSVGPNEALGLENFGSESRPDHTEICVKRRMI